MPVICVSGQKGGCGKTTLTANLAGELARRGREVIALDTDPQKSLTFWAGMGKADEVLSQIVRPADAEDHTAFRGVVGEARQEAEYVFIDTPPGLDDHALISALLSDQIMLPCIPSAPDVMSLKGGIDAMRKADADMFIVPWRTESRTRITEQMMKMMEMLGVPLAPGTSRRAAYSQSAFFGQIVAEYDPKSPAAEEIGRLADWIIAGMN